MSSPRWREPLWESDNNAIDVDLSIEVGDRGYAGVSKIVDFVSPYSHADILGFDFFKADAANKF